jgi:hypothetical protein
MQRGAYLLPGQKTEIAMSLQKLSNARLEVRKQRRITTRPSVRPTSASSPARSPGDSEIAFTGLKSALAKAARLNERPPAGKLMLRFARAWRAMGDEIGHWKLLILLDR